MVTSIGSAGPAQAAQAPVKKAQVQEAAVQAADATAVSSTANKPAETHSALSEASDRVGEQLTAQADASRVDRARAAGGGSAPTSDTESADYIAEADTNSDKKVSDQERIAYEKKLEQQAQDKSGQVQKAYGLASAAEPGVAVTA